MFVMRSSLESYDGSRRQTDEEGSGCDTALPNASMSRLMRYQQTLDQKEMFFGCSRSPNAEDWCAYHILRHHLFHCLCLGARRRNLQRFTQRTWMSNQPAPRQLQHVGSSSRPTNKKTTSCWSNSSLFRLLESRDRKRSGQSFSCTPIKQKKVMVAHQIQKLQGNPGAKVRQSEVLRRACLWNHKAAVNDAMWEAAA